MILTVSQEESIFTGRAKRFNTESHYCHAISIISANNFSVDTDTPDFTLS